MQSTVIERDNFSKSMRKRAMGRILNAKRKKFLSGAPISQMRTTTHQQSIYEFKKLCSDVNEAFKKKNLKAIEESLKPVISFLSSDETIKLEYVLAFKNADCFEISRVLLSEPHKHNHEITYNLTWIFINLSTIKSRDCQIFVDERIVDTFVDMMSYSTDVPTLINMFWALTNMVDRNIEVRDNMLQKEFSFNLQRMFESNQLILQEADEDFFIHLIELISKYCLVQHQLNFDAYIDLVICCNNYIRTYDVNSNQHKPLEDALQVLRVGTNVASGESHGLVIHDKCLGLQDNLLKIIKANVSPLAVSLCFDITGNMLSLFDDNDDMNELYLNFVIDHFYEELFNGIESLHKCLTESCGFLLSNICILSHDQSEKLATQTDFMNRIIQAIILSTDSQTLTYCIQSYTNFIGSLEINKLVEIILKDNEKYIFALNRIDENLTVGNIMGLLKIVNIMMQCAQNHADEAETENFVVANIVEDEQLTEKLEKLQMSKSDRVVDYAGSIIETFFQCEDHEMSEEGY